MSAARPLIVFVHGWGADASCWSALRAQLGDFESVAFDLGFFGDERRPAVPADRRCLAVAHSLGLLWLLRERPFRWDALVSIAGVARFTRADDFPAGVAPRVLERMIARARREPEATLDDFWARSGDAGARPRPDWTGFDAERLVRGLEWLGEWDTRAVLARDAVPLIAIAARDDQIVPPALTAATFERRAETIIAVAESGGHGLPWTRAAQTAGSIRAFAEAYG